MVQILDETMKKKLADEVENIRVEFDEKFRLVEDQKEELAKKFKDSETVTKTTQRQLEQTQSELYDAANKLSQKSDAKSEEVEMLLNDLESSNQRAILAEKEAESLREQLKSGSLFISSFEIFIKKCIHGLNFYGALTNLEPMPSLSVGNFLHVNSMIEFYKMN